MSKNTKIKTIAISILSFVGVITLSNQTWAAPVNTAFKDDKFYNCVVGGYNSYGKDSTEPTATTETNLTDDQLAKITRIGCQQDSLDGITDISGIEKLTNVTNIIINKGAFTSADFSKNLKLTDLRLPHGKLASINLSKNVALQYLSLANNNLNSISLSSNVALQTLILSNNKLSSLNLSSNVALNNIYVYGNSLQSLDLSNVPSYRSNWGATSSSGQAIGTPGRIYADDIKITIGLKAIKSGDAFYASTSGVEASFGFSNGKYSKVEETSSVKYYGNQSCPAKNINSTGNCIALTNLEQYPGYVQLTTTNSNNPGTASIENGLDTNKLTMKLVIVPVDDSTPTPSAPESTPTSPSAPVEPSSPSNTTPEVPNTGFFTGDNAGGIVVAISAGAITIAAVILFGLKYTKERLGTKVKFGRR